MPVCSGCRAARRLRMDIRCQYRWPRVTGHHGRNVLQRRVWITSRARLKWRRFVRMSLSEARPSQAQSRRIRVDERRLERSRTKLQSPRECRSINQGGSATTNARRCGRTAEPQRRHAMSGVREDDRGNVSSLPRCAPQSLASKGTHRSFGGRNRGILQRHTLHLGSRA